MSEVVGCRATDVTVGEGAIRDRREALMGKRSPFVGDPMLTVGEVAGTMRVSNMTVYRLINSGQLAAVRVGKNYRIRESDVTRYLSERAVKAEGQEAEGN